jgi:hypothetical protein
MKVHAHPLLITRELAKENMPFNGINEITAALHERGIRVSFQSVANYINGDVRDSKFARPILEEAQRHIFPRAAKLCPVIQQYAALTNQTAI